MASPGDGGADRTTAPEGDTGDRIGSGGRVGGPAAEVPTTPAAQQAGRQGGRAAGSELNSSAGGPDALDESGGGETGTLGRGGALGTADGASSGMNSGSGDGTERDEPGRGDGGRA